MWAAAGWYETVMELLAEQDNIEAGLKDDNGRTPLFFAEATHSSHATIAPTSVDNSLLKS